jgi:CheY-like chemotaxis protein
MRTRPRYRLLIAGDDRGQRETIVAKLRAGGHDVVAVGNGVELLNVLRTSLDPESDVWEFDFVISDVHLPGISGPRAFSRIGNNLDVPPVLFLTAFGDEEIREEAIRVGALAVLDKPVDGNELRAWVEGYLASNCN